jgi:hypothetical protein
MRSKPLLTSVAPIHGFKAIPKWSTGSKACLPNSTSPVRAPIGRPSGIKFTRSLKEKPTRLSSGVRPSPWCSRASTDRQLLWKNRHAAGTIPGGYVVSDASGQPIAYVYSRETEVEARQANVLTKDEARRIAVNTARLPELLGAAPILDS